MTSCWHEEPDKRPAFDTVRDDLMKVIENERYSACCHEITIYSPTDFH
jgi:hypothetical protein